MEFVRLRPAFADAARIHGIDCHCQRHSFP